MLFYFSTLKFLFIIIIIILYSYLLRVQLFYVRLLLYVGLLVLLLLFIIYSASPVRSARSTSRTSMPTRASSSLSIPSTLVPSSWATRRALRASLDPSRRSNTPSSQAENITCVNTWQVTSHLETYRNDGRGSLCSLTSNRLSGQGQLPLIFYVFSGLVLALALVIFLMCIVVQCQRQLQVFF